MTRNTRNRNAMRNRRLRLQHAFLTPVALKFGDLRLAVHAYVDLVQIDRSLRKSGFQATISRLERLSFADTEGVTGGDVRRAQRYSRRIDDAARWNLPRARCLHRSLVLHDWLRREGLPSTLRIGVSKLDNELKAHAWVELGNFVVNDPPTVAATFTLLRPADIGAKDTLQWT